MTADDLMPFVRENNPNWNWDEVTLWRHINWFLHFDLCQIVLDTKGEIIALGMARPVDTNVEDYVTNTEGDSIYVDFACSKNDLGKKYLYQGILSKIGSKKNIIFKRPKHNQLLRKYSLERFMNKFTKENI